MRIVVNTVGGNEYELTEITEFIFTQTAGTACDSLSVRFKSGGITEEIISVKAYDGGTLIFNGFCDCQKIKEDAKGAEIYFYARSSAALLVDSEAEPFTYNKPTARQLWFTFAKPFGFSCGMPVIQSDEKYEVTKGMSCYGAISQFVLSASGRQIYITPENSITLLEKSEDIKSLSIYNVLSASAVINRSEPLSEICFKKTPSAAGYGQHMKARIQDNLKLAQRKQYVNLSSLPGWQREYAVYRKLKGSYEDYRILEITVSGYANAPLYQRFSYQSKIGEYDDYLLAEKKYILSDAGETTRLTLKKEIDIKEITYVD